MSDGMAMAGSSTARIAAAVFVLGLTVAGPVAGVATAEGPQSDSAATSPDSSADHAPSAGPQRPTRGNRAPASDSSAPDGPTVERRGRGPVGGTTIPDDLGESPARPAPAAATVDASGHGRSKSTPSASPAAAVGAAPATSVHRESVIPAATEPPAALVGPTNPAPASVAPVPVAAAATLTLRAPHAAASSVPGASAVSSSGGGSGCSVCWGAQAPSLGQTVSTFVNHVFNSTFDWLSAALPGGVFSDLVTGALVLVRRSLFFVPEGVTASQTSTGLSISVNTGSTAYFRQDGTSLQVSGDPRFWGADTFTLNTGETVSVDNPGNAGCAGFVFAEGTAPGNLVTSQIDSLRFEGASAFTGSVNAAVIGRPLTLRDAVRGLSGVTIDAAVVLDNNVAVDAGKGNANFESTVDGTKTGKQALAVTALGTTVFAAPVGGTTPLSSLLTQGIAPLTVTQSSDSKTIPLHFLPEMSVSPPNDASPGVKYGIDVAIGNNASQVYEFDTGGTALFAGYNQPFWVDVPLTSTPASEVYNSGNYYDGVVSNTKITLGQGNQTVSTAQPIGIGAVFAGGNSKTGATFDFTNPAGPPVQGRFFGDFGASFAARNGLTSPLVQLPGNLASGFLVQLGPIGVTPQLTVGLTDDLRRQFPYAIPVILSPTGGTYPTSGYPILDQFGFAPVYTVTLNGDEQPLGTQKPQNISCTEQCLATLIDSGAPTTGIRLPDSPDIPTPFNDKGQLQSGTVFQATFPTTAGRPPLVWEFTAGSNPSVNEVNYETPRNAGNQDVNVGLTLYNYFDVMFDVVNKTIYLRPTGAQATVVAGSVTTTGNQTYRQNARLDGTYTTKGGAFSVAGVTALDGDTTVDAGRGDVTFSGTVDGDASLTVNSSGATRFVRVVGSLTPLASLTTDAGGTSESAGVTSSGNQTYGDPTSLVGLYTVDKGAFAVAGASTLVGSTNVVGGVILFGGTVDSQQAKGYQLGVTPGDKQTANFNGAIGSTNPLGSLRLSSAGTGTVNVTTSLALQGNLGYSAAKGLDIGDNVTANFAAGAVIQNFTEAGVFVEQAAPLTLNAFLLSGNGEEGILLQGASDVTISNSVLVGNKTGVNVGTSSNVAITGNTISNNATDGVTVTGSSSVVLTANVISGSGSNGVYVSGGQNNAILTNTITASGADGIRLDDARGVTIVDNTVSGSGSDGIDVAGGQDNSIVSNTITANGADGIRLDDARGLTIADNAISGNGTPGASSTAIKNGQKFQANGISVKGGTDIAIKSNSITANGVGVTASTTFTTTTYANGIYADGVAKLTASDNTITGNGTGAQNSTKLTIFANGIQLVNSGGPIEITGNTISGNGVLTKEGDLLTISAAGVYSDKSSPVLITDNTISANGSDGVQVATGNSNAILSNSIFGNAGKGISLVGGANGDQPAPEVSSAVLGTDGKLRVAGTVNGSGPFELQVFYSPSTDSGNVQGRQLIYSTDDVPDNGDFTYLITVPAPVVSGGFVTATLTAIVPFLPAPALNTSKFSGAVTVSDATTAV
jgi:parallel beta-helix repeat protein